MRNIVVTVALRANASSHQFLHDNVISRVEVKHQVNLDVVLGQLFSLSHCAGHTVEQHALNFFVGIITGILNDLNS